MQYTTVLGLMRLFSKHIKLGKLRDLFAVSLELDRLEDGLMSIPKMFGIDHQSYSSNFDYGKGKLRFNLWLKRWTNFLAKYVQDSDREILELKYSYDDNNCMPSGSGYGSKSKMLMTVFVKPFIDRIEVIREEIESGFFNLPDLSSLNGIKMIMFQMREFEKLKN